MAFLLILPLAVLSMVVLLVTSTLIQVEFAERRRASRKLRRRIFRPVLIEGGKGKIAAIDQRSAPPDEPSSEPAQFKLIRSGPP